jgi:hypothetical protein
MSYSKVTLKAVENITDKKMIPPTAWDAAAESMFPTNSTSIKKSCPKNAFLDLCEEGLVKGVNKEKCTRSDLNKAYAIKAAEILREKNQQFKPKELWKAVLDRLDFGVTKRHNSQMDVVLALWEKGLIV